MTEFLAPWVAVILPAIPVVLVGLFLTVLWEDRKDVLKFREDEERRAVMESGGSWYAAAHKDPAPPVHFEKLEDIAVDDD